jgi:hypothetical protein
MQAATSDDRDAVLRSVDLGPAMRMSRDQPLARFVAGLVWVVVLQINSQTSKLVADSLVWSKGRLRERVPTNY